MQATDTELRIEIERLTQLQKDTKTISESNFQLYLKLQDAVKSFFEGNIDSGADSVYLSLDSINSFFCSLLLNTTPIYLCFESSCPWQLVNVK